MPKVLVIGGGIVGLLTAAALKDGGADVEVFASQTGPRASDGSLVWLNVSSTHDPTYAALRAASMRFWHKSDAPVPWQGALLWPENEPATDLLTSQNCDWEAVDQTRFSELAPGVAAPPDGAIFCPGEGACDPADMLNWAEARLDVPRNQAHVVGVEPGCVTLDTGDVVHPDKIIVAAGCATPGLVAPLGAHIALKSAPGLFLRTQPVAPMARPVLASPDMDFWQGADGRMVIATGTNDVLRQDPQAAADQALSKVRSLMPAVGELEIESMGVYQRPVPQDGLPVVGEVANGVFVAVMHSGMTMAPIVAACLCAEVLGTQPPHDLTPYRPRQMS